MADEPKKPAVTDSRMPGFNPEVEESKAAEAAAAAKAAAGPTPAADAEKKERAPLPIMADILAEIVDHLGNAPRFDALLEELSAALSK
jgi:hypothetical protein